MAHEMARLSCGARQRAYIIHNHILQKKANCAIPFRIYVLNKEITCNIIQLLLFMFQIFSMPGPADRILHILFDDDYQPTKI